MDVNWNLTSCHMHTAVSYSLFSATLHFFLLLYSQVITIMNSTNP